ncbi:helix-turn-helix domain-containing protein [Corynebacterium pyruviciproducens]|uniref:Helix-turn-helix transcriptional regulator n=1 Tax=Corynebacterium pyruviciproducens TaxID=598660 RepID=A0AAF1BXI0_9CORY|nr:helix-turn-helix transcriptional regulator [Corynebacterium pyruviciproducens]WOT02886.1 helix-turn-helix transcriptional regulator [Corynebacterium pyruviciproducens]
MSTGNAFAKNIVEFRESNGWTRADVLRALERYGFSMYPTTLKRIEEGTQIAKIDEAVALAAVFGVSVSDLVEPFNTELWSEYGALARVLDESQEQAFQSIFNVLKCAVYLHQLQEKLEKEAPDSELYWKVVATIELIDADMAETLMSHALIKAFGSSAGRDMYEGAKSFEKYLTIENGKIVLDLDGFMKDLER